MTSTGTTVEGNSLKNFWHKKELVLFRTLMSSCVEGDFTDLVDLHVYFYDFVVIVSVVGMQSYIFLGLSLRKHHGFTRLNRVFFM